MSQGRIFTGAEVGHDLERRCDVCVVGSGAGGAMVAHQLVEAGKSVVLLEEGGHHTRREFDMREDTAFPMLYQELGNRATDDLSITILQGRSVGGGTTVNWCSSFRTPEKILAHWRDAHGVEGLTTESLTPHWEAIEERLHIAEWPEERMNANNRVLWDGAGKLGYQRGLIRRNVNKCADLGYCGLGCPIDAKQSMLVTLIPDAVERGLTVYANARALKVETAGRRAASVVSQILDPVTDAPTGKMLRVYAKATVISAGAINSPALLLRSRLDGNGRVGKRTFLHPTVVSAALFDHPVEAYYGAPQSVYSHHFSDRGAGKLGYFLEVPPVHPMLAAVTLTGFGGAHQERMALLPNLHAMIALTVDGLLPEEEGGTVRLRRGEPNRLSIDYPLGPLHWEAFRDALKTMARIQFAAGARSVHSLHAEPVMMTRVEELPLLDRASYAPNRLRVVTAHQLGGCAMGKDPNTSVVDSTLRYHGLDNLFVIDGSVFPTALGVNPQESIFGVARWASAHVAAAV